MEEVREVEDSKADIATDTGVLEALDAIEDMAKRIVLRYDMRAAAEIITGVLEARFTVTRRGRGST